MIDVTKYFYNVEDEEMNDEMEIDEIELDEDEFDYPAMRDKLLPKYSLEFEESLPALKKEETLYVSYDRVYNLGEILYIALNNLELHKAFTEHLYVIMLNTNNDILGISEVSHGSYNSTITPIKEILITVLLSGASRFYLLHNHPNNVNKLSDADKLTVGQVKAALVYLEIDLLDSIVITPDKRYTSLMLELEEK